MRIQTWLIERWIPKLFGRGRWVVWDDLDEACTYDEALAILAQVSRRSEDRYRLVPWD